MNDWNEHGKHERKRGKKEEKGKAISEKHIPFLLHEQEAFICSLHHKLLTKTRELCFTDSLYSQAEEIISTKGIKVGGFSCSVILTWKQGNTCLRYSRNEIKEQKELVFLSPRKI